MEVKTLESNEPSRRSPIPAGWLIVTENVPTVWRERARTVTLIPLVPEELKSLIDGHRTQPTINPEHLPIMTAIARGMPAREIAREIGVTPRTVYRHVARLRESFNVDTLAELGAELARRGF